MKISLGYQLIWNKNLCNHGYIPLDVITLLNYDDNQFDSLSRRIYNSEWTINCDKRQIDEDQPWLTANMLLDMWNYGYILFNVIASFDYNDNQFGPFIQRNFISESQSKHFRRQIDEDQLRLPANM